MPRETVGDRSGNVVVVSWGRDAETVQVVTVNGGGQMAVIGVEQQEAIDGWYVTLASRSALNRLIGVLKTARDQAFGRDE